MIHLDCAGRVAATSLAAILILSGAASAHPPARHQRPHPVRHIHAREVVVPTPRPELELAAKPAPSDVTLAQPVLSIIADDAVADADATPRIVKSIRRIYCVPFARLRSGIELFGNANTWWAKARGLYARNSDPTPGAVMVFAGTRRMIHGHVAVVTRIVSNREVLVDHANWRMDGNIYLNAPVIDVSASNDWSKVRVWDTAAGQLGIRTYPLKGFVSFRTAALSETSNYPER